MVRYMVKEAYTPKGPVALSMVSKAPIIPGFIIREDGKHRIVFEDPIEIEEKSTKEETIKFNTQKWSRVVESYIRKHPGQWVWMHDRWKTRP